MILEKDKIVSVLKMEIMMYFEADLKIICLQQKVIMHFHIMKEQVLTDISNWEKLNSFLSTGKQQVILGDENNYDILSIMCASLSRR